MSSISNEALEAIVKWVDEEAERRINVMLSNGELRRKDNRALLGPDNGVVHGDGPRP